VEKEWEIIDEIQGQFYEKHIRSPRRTANAAAEWDLVQKVREAKCFEV